MRRAEYVRVLRWALEGNAEDLQEFLRDKSFFEILVILEEVSGDMERLNRLRENLIVAADETSPHANRSKIIEAARLSRMTVYRLLERRGRAAHRAPRG